MGEGPHHREESEAANAGDAALGPAPGVAGRDRIRAAARAKLFGPAPGDEAAPELAAASGTIAAGSDRLAGPSTSAPEDIPGRLGRFRVLSCLGRGGMGEVYEAYDPELDRKVALKVLRAELRGGSAGEAGPARLVREAQAMARLSDEHVITVYEVGTFGQGDDALVFVAMELVEGQTLGAWMRERPSWADVLSVFRRAGAGLAAAHRAGLVHRDFKPDNVLLGKDGRIRVLDFGLARAMAGSGTKAAPDEHARPRRTRPGADPLQTPLTQTGAVMGTPAYMSPEQHLGRPADARSDQFSFCVALWEALYGVRPFPGKSYPELVRNVLDGSIESSPAQARVPRWVRAAVLEGLARDPRERHADMDALLARLGRDPVRRWWRLGAGVGAAGLASAATFAFVEGDDTKVDACAEVGARLAGVWDEERKGAVRLALSGAGPAGPRIWASTERLLDEYASAWTTTASEACAASLVAARLDDPIHDKRAACIEMRLVELEQMIDILVEADAALAHEAVQAVATLSDVHACGQARRLEAWRAPTDPEARERLGRARAELATAKARGLLGEYDAAIELAQSVIDEARQLDDPATEAAGLLVRGQYEERAGKKAAEDTLRDAVTRAEVAGDHATRVQASTHLVWIVGQDRSRYEEARALGVDAHAVIKVLGGAPVLEARLDTNLGTAAMVARDLDGAREAYERSLETLIEQVGEEHPETARALANLGTVFSHEGKHTEAEGYLRRALSSMRSVLGEEHPLVATIVGNLGQNLGRRERYREAIPLFERSLEIRKANFELEHPLIAKSYFNLGFTLHQAGEDARALEHFRSGLELRQRVVGPADPSLHPWFALLGLAHAELEQWPLAVQWLDRALEARKGEDDYALSTLRFDAAKAMLHVDADRARALAERSAAAIRLHLEDSTDSKDTQDAQAKLDAVTAWLESHGD